MNSYSTFTKIATALLKAQRSMGNATKDSKNPFFKSSYADLNSIREAVMPSLNENGITVLQPTVYRDGKAFVHTVLMHESGECISSDTEIISGKQNDPQAAGSGISYARRYGLQSFLNVGAVDDDGESAMDRNKQTSKIPYNADITVSTAITSAVSSAQVAVARKIITKEDLLKKLSSTYEVSAATITDGVRKLTQQQLKQFTKEMETLIGK